MKAKTFGDALLLLEDMRDYAMKAKRFSSGRPFEDLRHDEAYRFAILYALQVVGEAATKVPDAVKLLAPGIPWPLIVAFRHAVVHGYGEVRLDRVQAILDEGLDPLVAALDAFIPEVERREDQALP